LQFSVPGIYIKNRKTSVSEATHHLRGSAGVPGKFGPQETGYERFWTSSGFAWADVSRESLRVSFIGASEAVAEGETLYSFAITQ
jgi:hypothetical protein